MALYSTIPCNISCKKKCRITTPLIFQVHAVPESIATVGPLAYLLFSQGTGLEQFCHQNLEA